MFKNRFRKNQSGFSLIELMIVIAVIGLLVAVGIPSYNFIIKSGNETAAITSLRQMSERQAQYAARKKGEFADTFDKLVTDTGFNENFKGTETVHNGYTFKLAAEPRAAGKAPFYKVTATPEATGSKHFYIDSNSGTVKQSEDGEATATSPPI